MAITDFDTAYYFNQRPDVLADITNGRFVGTAQDHYNQIGWRELADPNPQFDTSFYLSNYPDILAGGINPFEHFVNYGLSEGRIASEPAFTLTADAPEIFEGDAGTKVLTYTLTLDRAPTEAVTVNYHTETSGSATAGDDFEPTAGTVTFAAGQTIAMVAVTVLGDGIIEADETVA